VIEGAAEAVAGRAPLRVWCAACATGQEPLSLAMLFAEAGGAMPEIVATDVSAAAIARAREGTYSQFEIQRGLPVRRMVKWFEPAPDNHWRASAALLGAIHFRRHNLIVDMPPAGEFDLILCRNLLFYFAPHQREQVLARLAGALKPDGLLLLGAGETVIGQSERLRPSVRARGFYERVPSPGDSNRVYTGH
jgi:chemotaxis protein methyltransferase CheR